MIRLLLILPVSLFSLVSMAQHTLSLSIRSLPEYHPAGSDIYIAGSFNGWNPQDGKYKFIHDGNGQYSAALQLPEGSYEYKLTRGGWDKAECKKDGSTLPNRVLNVSASAEISLTVEEWADRFPAAPRRSTASSHVAVLDTAFLIPQLKRTRRVWIYLPASYSSGIDRYPVLYLHDGQNMFDDATSFSGEWGLDEFLDSTSLRKCIVVAIDHGGNKRLNEYNPYDNDRFGKGEGGEYAGFLARTLKPFIDTRYRTLAAKEHTFIAGSSMGGLISLYAVLQYPDTFGGAGVFSPAFWITGGKMVEEVRNKGKNLKARIYFYAGKLEGETMVPDMLQVSDVLTALTSSELVTVIRDEGKHNEAAWRKEFPLFYEWLLKR